MEEDHGKFSILDYTFFLIVFLVSAAIGLYYAIKSRKTITTVDDYLLGGRNMGLLPVICSLVATSMSGSAIVGLSAEAYAHGTHVWMYMFCVMFAPIIVPWVFFPVFYELKLTSSFKYLELRFNRRVRLLASGIFLLTGLLFLPVTIYVPALTFQKVSGLNIYVTATILSLLCASYTAMGGFRAVIWTDVVQLALTLIACLTVGVIGIQSAGGISNVFEAADRGGRIIIVNVEHLNTRSSLPGYIFSVSIVKIYQNGLSQTNLQRFLSLSSVRRMTISAWIYVLIISTIFFLTPLLGIIMFANYETCDPFNAGIIQKIDQILPHFVQEKASLFPGFNGIFIAGIFSAGLSTTSSYLNSMSGIIYEDFISQRLPDSRTASKIMRAIVFLLSAILILLIFLIEKMGMITQITIQCLSLNSGALFTLFVLGVLVPKANSTGAIFGAVAAILSMLTLIIGNMDKKPDPTLPFRTDGCENGPFNSTIGPLDDNLDDVFWLFRISFLYYGIIGIILGITIGYLVSLMTGGNIVEDQRLLAPFLRRKRREEEVRLRNQNTSSDFDCVEK